MRFDQTSRTLAEIERLRKRNAELEASNESLRAYEVACRNRIAQDAVEIERLRAERQRYADVSADMEAAAHEQIIKDGLRIAELEAENERLRRLSERSK